MKPGVSPQETVVLLILLPNSVTVSKTDEFVCSVLMTSTIYMDYLDMSVMSIYIYRERESIYSPEQAYIYIPSFIIWTGLKKCNPTNLSGRPLLSAMSVICKLEVLEAKIQEGLICGPKAL